MPASRAPARPLQRYEVKEQLARGGMGTVYRAFDRATLEEVALKRMLLDDPARRSWQLAAFEREYQVLASLDHPRIIRVHDFGVDAEGPYYTMELLRGVDLGTAAPRPWREVCRLARDIATSLVLLHARRLLHRDLSPSNVKLGEDGRAKLLDFGALTDFGVNPWLVGTPPLVPPEALRGDALDQRSDLYALGALCYWALTGQHAYPARELVELPDRWEEPPCPPSTYVPDIPRALDQLVLGLLNRDPLGRPESAALVIARLKVIGELGEELESDRRRIAQSFLIEPPFVGRSEQLGIATARLSEALQGRGAAVRVEGIAGSGRSRLLDEIGMRAQFAGAAVLRVDSSMHPNHHGTARALALRLLDAVPDLAREHASQYAPVIAQLGREVELRVALTPSKPPAAQGAQELGSDLSDWLVDVSRHKPLLIAIDNTEACDQASLGVLARLLSRLSDAPILCVVSERLRLAGSPNKAMSMVQELASTLPIANLTAQETVLLSRSLFGDVPGVERFADWLYGRTAGSPLHCVEITRELIERDVVRHEDGLWLLPTGRPEVELPDALEDALSIRIAKLGARARALAQVLSVQRGEPSLMLCTRLTDDTAERTREQEALSLLDDLARNDILHSDPSGYRFVSAALRDALIASMDARDSASAHRRLGAVFEAHAAGDPEQLMEAGWHYMRAGADVRGADLVLRVLTDMRAMREFGGRGYRVSPLAEAALEIFKRHRRGPYQRLPLLVAIAQATYFEDYLLTARYADEAVELVDELGGLRLARHLRRWFGAHLALPIALLLTWLRFLLTPKTERPYSFVDSINFTLTTLVPLVAAKSMALDGERADRLAAVLSPFEVLPERATPRAIHDFCVGLTGIAREDQVRVFEICDRLARRFADRRWYRLMPDDARTLLTAGSLYARGAFAVFRADGRVALESADALEATGLKQYAIQASQLRALYHAHRGELALAAPHRAQVDLFAAQSGSAWNVELWEPAALIPLYISLSDPIGLAHVVSRLDALVRVEPSLALFRQLAELSRVFVNHEGVDDRTLRHVELAREVLAQHAPRSFIGWNTAVGAIAAAYNQLGRHQDARALCETALQTTSDPDREYVALFLEVELQASLADAALGQHEHGTRRLDGLLARFTASGHPLALGRLHETRALLSLQAGDVAAYRQHLAQAEHWFRTTRTPALIGKAERLAELDPANASARRRARFSDVGDLSDTSDTHIERRG